MIFIHEGVDRTGKTTLAKQFAEELDLPYYHFGVPGPDPAAEYLAALARVGPDGAIFDRFHLGEYVWPWVFKRDSNYWPDGFRAVEEALLARDDDVVILYHTRDRDDIAADLVKHREALRPHDLDWALQLYQEAIRNSRIRVMNTELVLP